MKQIFILNLWMAVCYHADAQTITIKNKASGEPIAGARLTSEKPKQIVLTNIEGQVDIAAFKHAEKIKIHALGFGTVTKSYTELQAATFELFLTPSNVDLNSVVVYAMRWNQNAGNQPAKTISISPKTVALQNPQTAADLLGISGKVFIQKSQQGGGSPMIRGFATNRLIYTVDGVRMNTAIFRGGNLQNVINIDPFSTESTEVIFGPGSVIYGSDAIGGVMSFQTLTPKFSVDENPKIKGKALMRYSSANREQTGHFDVNLGWKKWALVSSFSSWDFKNLRQGSKGPTDYLKGVYAQRQGGKDKMVTQEDPLLQIPSAYSQFNLMQKLRYVANENWDMQYGFHYSTTSPFGRYDRHNRFRNGSLRYAEWNYGPQSWLMNNLNISHNKKNLFYDQMTLRLAYQVFEESRIDREFNNEMRNEQEEKVKAYSANFDLTKQLSEKHHFFYGLEYVKNDVGSTGLITNITTNDMQQGPSRYPKSDWKSFGFYLNDQFNISKKMKLQTGIRYSHFWLDANFNTKFYPFPFTKARLNKGTITGSTGLVFKPGNNWVISANAGTAFRSPNVDDMGKVFDSEPGAVTVPNPNLKSEYAYNIDMGVAKIFGKNLKIDCSIYYTRLKDALVRRDFKLNGLDSIMYNGEMSKVQAIQNAAVGKVFGLQWGMELNLPLHFFFITDINYQLGKELLENSSESPSQHAPPIFGLSRLRYQKNKLILEWNVIFQGEKSFDNLPVEEKAKQEIYAKDSNGNNYAPSWYTLNFKAMYNLSENFSFSAGIENLTDQRYRPYSSGISGAGRNFILSLKTSF